jgi:predicted DNA-binding transcriptional regulator AlpA
MGTSLERPVARSRPNSPVKDRDIFRDEDRLLRPKAIAAETEVSEKTVRRWIELRGLPSQKLGGLRVVRKRDLVAFLDHTFDTMLQRAGVSPRVVMELMRHSDMRLTMKTYTDTTCLPLFGELDKLNPFLPSSIASPKIGKSCQNAAKGVQTDPGTERAEIVDFRVKEAALDMAAQLGKTRNWRRGRDSNPRYLAAHLISSQSQVCWLLEAYNELETSV